ncbi:MAG: peptidase M28, partial [Gemmatimonadota bacterium]
MRRTSALILLLAILVSLVGCEAGTDMAISLETAGPALETITTDEIMDHVARLSSDRFRGRAPGTAGEDSTVAYLTEQFQALGLEPGNPDGSWTQALTLVGIRSQATGSITLDGRTLPLRNPDDFVGVSYRDDSAVRIDDSEVVFVGYGVEAPEYDWDDYAGRDMTGKTLVMLVNDPPVRV